MPKRTSQRNKKLNGSQHLKPTTAATPISAKPAAGLDAIGQAEWKRINKAFARSGRLTDLDEAVLSLYCAAFSRWKRAQQALAEQGEVISVPVHDTHGKEIFKKPIVNPMSKVIAEAARQVHRYGESLGLSPAARTKQGIEFDANKKDEDDDEDNEFKI